MQPVLLARLVLVDENKQAHAPANANRQRLIQPHAAALFDRAGDFDCAWDSLLPSVVPLWTTLQVCLVLVAHP